jgi:putative salt-induced outer membrane protein YdiY
MAQVNTENMLPSSVQEGLNFSFAATAGLARGNSEFASLNTATRIDYIVPNDYTAFVVGNLDYREGNNQKIANRGFAHIRYIKQATELISPEVFVQRQFNAFTNLLDRSLGGGGVRFVFIDSQNTPDSILHIDFMLGIGAMYEKEVLRTPDRYTTEIPRSTNYLNFRLKSESGISLNSVVYYQPSLTYAEDWRFLSTAGLSFPILKNLSFIVNFNYSYDNEPPIGIEKYDLELSNGIRINL